MQVQEHGAEIDKRERFLAPVWPGTKVVAFYTDRSSVPECGVANLTHKYQRTCIHLPSSGPPNSLRLALIPGRKVYAGSPGMTSYWRVCTRILTLHTDEFVVRWDDGETKDTRKTAAALPST